MTGFAWTDERVDQLKILWNSGLSATQCAVKLGGVTRNAVIGKVFRMGWQRNEAAIRVGRQLSNARKVPRRAKALAQRSRAAKPRRIDRDAQRGVATSRLRPLGPPAPPVVIDATKAKPWLERGFGECAYPISGEGADTFSCCQPTEATYCLGHAALMFVQPHEVGKRYARSLRRWAA